MSRSRRRSPFIGHTTAETDKPWKQQSARQVRRAAHQVLATTIDGDAVPDRKGLGDAYGLKDGKQRIADPRTEDWRKSRGLAGITLALSRQFGPWRGGRHGLHGCIK